MKHILMNSYAYPYWQDGADIDPVCRSGRTWRLIETVGYPGVLTSKWTGEI